MPQREPAEIAGHVVSIGSFAIRGIEIRELRRLSEILEALDLRAVEITLHVVDVETGRAETTVVERRLPRHEATDHLGPILRALLVEAFAHEVDEWLRVDGQRVREPHPETTQR
jgi:hypothetical protein